MKKYLLELLDGLKKVYWWIINGCIIAVSTLLAVLVPQCIQINENQILYYMSCLAQVTAAIYVLVLAAYTIADARLKNMVADYDTLCDYATLGSEPKGPAWGLVRLSKDKRNLNNL